MMTPAPPAEVGMAANRKETTVTTDRRTTTATRKKGLLAEMALFFIMSYDFPMSPAAVSSSIRFSPL
jgi:hypothetical protein